MNAITSEQLALLKNNRYWINTTNDADMSVEIESIKADLYVNFKYVFNPGKEHTTMRWLPAYVFLKCYTPHPTMQILYGK